MANNDVTEGPGVGNTAHDLQLPLSGVRVLDLCTGPGCTAARFLADLGADVVVVEAGDVAALIIGFRILGALK